MSHVQHAPGGRGRRPEDWLPVEISSLFVNMVAALTVAFLGATVAVSLRMSCPAFTVTQLLGHAGRDRGGGGGRAASAAAASPH